MTPSRVDLRALLEAATPQPWYSHVSEAYDDAPCEEISQHPDGKAITFRGQVYPADAALIVAAVNSLPHLLDLEDAARLIRAYDQAGGNEWWEAHAKLYAALSALDEQEGK